MRTLMIMTWEGVSPAQYDEVRKAANWEGDIPKGAVFHVAGFHNNALRVTDIWESPEDFNAFVQNRLMPAVAKAELANQPQVELFPVYALFSPVALN